MKKKFFKNFIITFIILILIIQYLGVILRPVQVDNSFNLIKTFHNIPKDSVEVIGFGSSRIWRGLNVMEMYNNYGIGAFNYGNNWQRINTTKLFIKDALETQKPKVILLEVNYANEVIKDTTSIEPEIYYTRALRNFDGKKEFLRQCFKNNKERYIGYYFPIYSFHDNWENITKKSFSFNSDKNDFYKTMGYWNIKGTKKVQLNDYTKFKQKKLSKEALKELDEIVEICKQNNIQIIFLSLPSIEEYNYFDAIEQYALSNGYVYFNFYELAGEIGIDESTDFNDPSHLNDNGAKKVSNFLGNYIINNYNVSDMRLISNNIWEKNSLR